MNFLLTILFVLWQPPFEATSFGQTKGEELKSEAESKAEIDIVTAVIPPYTYQEAGKPRGLIVEIVQAMAKHAGHSGKIRFLPWKRALSETLEDFEHPHLIIPLNRSPEREDKFEWVQQLYIDETVLVTKKGNAPPIKKIEDAIPLKTGVLLGSPLEVQIRKLGFKEVEAAVDEETNARKLNFGRILVWHVARLVAPFVFERHGFFPKDLEYHMSLGKNDLYLGATRTVPRSTVEAWREAFRKIKADGTYDAIVKKYHF